MADAPAYLERLAGDLKADGHEAATARAIALNTFRKWSKDRDALDADTRAHAKRIVRECEKVPGGSKQGRMASGAHATPEELRRVGERAAHRSTIAEGLMQTLRDGSAKRGMAMQSARVLLEGKSAGPITLNAPEPDNGDVQEMLGRLKSVAEVDTLLAAASAPGLTRQPIGERVDAAELDEAVPTLRSKKGTFHGMHGLERRAGKGKLIPKDGSKPCATCGARVVTGWTSCPNCGNPPDVQDPDHDADVDTATGDTDITTQSGSGTAAGQGAQGLSDLGLMNAEVEEWSGPVVNLPKGGQYATPPAGVPVGAVDYGAVKGRTGKAWNTGKHPRGYHGKFIQSGASGTDVTRIQHLVGAQPTGVYDAQTTAAVKRYQQQHGLQADGIVGRQTIAHLTGMSAGGPGALTGADVARMREMTSRSPTERARVSGTRTAPTTSKAATKAAKPVPATSRIPPPGPIPSADEQQIGGKAQRVTLPRGGGGARGGGRRVRAGQGRAGRPRKSRPPQASLPPQRPPTASGPKTLHAAQRVCDRYAFAARELMEAEIIGDPERLIAARIGEIAAGRELAEFLWDPEKHPRDRAGRWSFVHGKLQQFFSRGPMGQHPLDRLRTLTKLGPNTDIGRTRATYPRPSVGKVATMRDVETVLKPDETLDQYRRRVHRSQALVTGKRASLADDVSGLARSSSAVATRPRRPVDQKDSAPAIGAEPVQFGVGRRATMASLVGNAAAVKLGYPADRPRPRSQRMDLPKGTVEKLISEHPQRPGEELFAWQGRIVRGLDPKVRHEVLFRIRERYDPVDYIAKGATRFRKEHGLPEPKVNVREVPADMTKADKVGKAFEMSGDESKDPKVLQAFQDFKRQNQEMWDFATKPEGEGGLGIKVDFSPNEAGDPYPTAAAQAEDLRQNHHITTQSGLGGNMPLLTTEEYDRFRAVHDIFGHAAVGGGFDRHGEYEAWLQHMSMYTGAGRDAMSSEYHGVNSSLWAGLPGTPGTGRALLLPSSLITNPWLPDGTLAHS